MTQLELQKETVPDPFILFEYSIRSPYTKESYFRRLKRFFDVISLEETTFENRCNFFAEKGKQDPTWAFNCILKFVLREKQRVENREITGGTLRNSVKTIKTFCEVTDVLIPWKKITRGLPRVKRYADDRAPTLEEIKKIIEYPDRRIKPIVYTMASSGIRVGAWDYLKWCHIIPVNSNGRIVAAKLIVYANEPDEYFTFVTPEAYFALESWMKFRSSSGESINVESWIMRNLWNTLRPRENSISRKTINEQKKFSNTYLNMLEPGNGSSLGGTKNTPAAVTESKFVIPICFESPPNPNYLILYE